MKAVMYCLLSLCLLGAPAMGQQNTGSKQNPLVDGKLMYVGRMPENIDSWIIYDLKAWGKYTPTRDPEGVDLTMKAYEPEKRTEYEMRGGIPHPKEVRKRRAVMFSISVNDWVTGRLVWQAEVLDRKPKRNPDVKPSDDVEIPAKGLSTQQLAQEIIRVLRRYVDHLAVQPGVR